jgi:hypothetical protein
LASHSRAARVARYRVGRVALTIPSLRVRSGDARAPFGLGPVVAGGTEWADVNGRVAIRTSRHSAGAAVELVGVAHYALSDGTDLVEAWPEETRADAVVAAEFDRSVVPLFLSYRGALYLHASGVVTGAGVVAICGRSGSGKSTLAAALAARGHGVWADDAIVIDPSPSPPVSVHLGSPLRLDAQSVALVGAGPAGAGSGLVRGDIRPLAGIVVLERGTGMAMPELDRLSGGAAFAAVLEHALCFSLQPSDRADLVARFLAVLAWAPVERLRFTANASDFARLVDNVHLHLERLRPEG